MNNGESQNSFHGLSQFNFRVSLLELIAGHAFIDQPVRIAPATWESVEEGDIVYCKVHGNYYTHIVHAKNQDRGYLIGNNHGHINGWTKYVYGKVIEVLNG